MANANDKNNEISCDSTSKMWSHSNASTTTTTEIFPDFRVHIHIIHRCIDGGVPFIDLRHSFVCHSFTVCDHDSQQRTESGPMLKYVRHTTHSHRRYDTGLSRSLALDQMRGRKRLSDYSRCFKMKSMQIRLNRHFGILEFQKPDTNQLKSIKTIWFGSKLTHFHENKTIICPVMTMGHLHSFSDWTGCVQSNWWNCPMESLRYRWLSLGRYGTFKSINLELLHTHTLGVSVTMSQRKMLSDIHQIWTEWN